MCRCEYGHLKKFAPMRKDVCFIAFLLLLMVACSNNSNTRTTATTTDSSVIKKEIIPGERVGAITIGLNADSVEARLGLPDASDAAMGKAWLTWKGKNNLSVLNIYTAYKDTTLSVKTVQQIRSTSNFFKTPTGAQVGQSLAQIKQQFPAAVATSTYTEDGAPHTLYDDIAAGIAFEISDELCKGMIVHKKGERADAIYIMLHPGMKKL